MLLLLPFQVQAALPDAIPLQGRVSVNGQNFTGTGQFRFAIYTAPSADFRPATATATVNNGFVTAITVNDGGAGYTSGVTVSVLPGGFLGNLGSGATATATVTNGAISSITVTNQGSGYSAQVSPLDNRPRVRFDEPTVTTLWTNASTAPTGDPLQPTTSVSLPVVNGLYVAGLGDPGIPQMSALPASLSAAGKSFVRVWFNDGVNGFQLLSPDVELRSVPFAREAGTAVTAQSALSVTNGAITSSSLADGSVTAAKLAPGAVTGVGPTAVSQATVSDSGMLSVYGSLEVNTRPNPFTGIIYGVFLRSNTDWALATSARADGVSDFFLGSRNPVTNGYNDRLRVTPEGRVVVPNNGNFGYQTPRTRRSIIHGAMFQPQDPVGAFTGGNVTGVRRHPFGMRFALDAMVVQSQVDLPHGATITVIRMRLADASSTAGITSATVSLLRGMRGETTFASIGSATNSVGTTVAGMTPGNAPLTVQSASILADSKIVDNNNFTYVVTCEVILNNTISNSISAITLMNAEVEYTIDTLQP